MAYDPTEFDPNVPLPTGKPTDDDLSRKHRSWRAKAIDKIVMHSTPHDRIQEFLEDEVQNFEEILKWASGSTVTKQDILAATASMIQDRKDDIAEIVPFLATGQLIQGVIKK